MDHPGGVDAPSVCVAIPARNEAEEIIGCLEAIAACTGGPARLGLVVFVNNSTDATARKAREWSRSGAPAGLSVTVHEGVLPAREASAGRARALAMARARACLPESGLLLTTDADSRPAPGWVREMVAELAGCDLALGPIAPRPGTSPARLRIYDRIEREALALQARILQRDGAEPHQHVSGASLGLRASAWDRLGGLPDVPCGEDRALAAAARRAGLRVSHVAIAPVLTSWRLVGRAQGGHAETLAQRLSTADPYCDDRILPLAGLRERAERIGRPEMVEAGRSGDAGGAGQGIGVGYEHATGQDVTVEDGDRIEAGTRAANAAGTPPWPPASPTPPWPDPLPAVTLHPLAQPDPDPDQHDPHQADPDRAPSPALRMSEVQAMLPTLRQLAGERPPPGPKGAPRP